jgi:hypothetical protein
MPGGTGGDKLNGAVARDHVIAATQVSYPVSTRS